MIKNKLWKVRRYICTSILTSEEEYHNSDFDSCKTYQWIRNGVSNIHIIYNNSLTIKNGIKSHVLLSN